MNKYESIFELGFFIVKQWLDCVFVKKSYEFLRKQ